MTTQSIPSEPRKRGLLRAALWSAAGLLLLAPLIAMQFTAEVNWTAFDFLAFGVLLALTGGACELAVRKINDRRWRIGALALIALVFVIIWAEGAVGVFR